VAVLALGATTVTTAHADDPLQPVVKAVGIGGIDAPIDRLGDVGGGVVGGPGGFPPAGFAVTAVTWSMGPGDLTPTFTPPNPATSHPANWSCTTSLTSTTAHASCMPTDPPDPGTSGWACYDPYVVVDVTSAAASTGDSITGSSHCGTSYATCTATTPTIGVPAPAHCSNWAFPHQPVPLECDADFSFARPTATWNVRCAPIDP